VPSIPNKFSTPLLQRWRGKNSWIVDEKDIHLGHSFTADARLASSRCRAVRADHPTSCRSPDGAVRLRLRTDNTAPGPGQRTHQEAERESARGQQSLRTRTEAPRAARTSHGTVAAHDVLPPFPTGRESISPERTGSSSKLEELVGLVVSLRDTIKEQSSMIANQNRVIESVQSELAAIKAEQQHVKDQNTELQETIRSLRAQIDTLSASPPSTQRTWASVAF